MREPLKRPSTVFDKPPGNVYHIPKQCSSVYEVWRCMGEEGHKSLHESYTVSKARILWTHDFSIALCIQSKNPSKGLSRADLS